MELEFLGLKFRLEVVVVCVLLGYLIGGFVLCSCSKTHLKEGFGGTLPNLEAAPLDSAVNQADWAQDAAAYQAGAGGGDIYKNLVGNVGGEVPLPPGEMFFFYDNQFKPECCNYGNGYSSSDGCACTTVQQMEYLNARAGNRAPGGIF